MNLRLFAAGAMFALSACAGTINIASQATFTPAGGMTGSGTLLNDGITRQGEVWNNSGTVNWTNDSLILTITFASAQTILGAQVWGNSDDVYRLEAWAGGSWQQMFVVPHNLSISPSEIFPRHAGLVGNDPFHASFASFTTDTLRIFRQNDTPPDGQYSLSEIELYVNNPVPEPSTFLLLGAGLAGLILRKRV